MTSLRPFSQGYLLWTTKLDMGLIPKLGAFTYRISLYCMLTETATVPSHTTLFSPSWLLERMNHHLVADRSIYSDKPVLKSP